MTLPAFVHFSAELKRLRGLSAACEYSFGAAQADLGSKVRTRKIDAKLPIFLPLEPSIEAAPSAYAFLNQLRRRYPAYIRETILVRLVSTLELLLVDCIRDIFIKRTELFADHKRTITLTHGEVLSSDGITGIRDRIISSELRQLHSKGIRDISKYYKKVLDIEFSTFGINLKRFWEFIDRRHLIVHRLGRADEAYRHAYGYTAKANISVSREELTETFSMFQKFKEELETRALAIYEAKPPENETRARQTIAEIEITPLTEAGREAADPTFSFLVNDRKRGERAARLSDILKLKKETSEGVYVLNISGPDEVVESYTKRLKKLKSRGDLKTSTRLDGVHKKTRPRDLISKPRTPTSLNRETLESIAISLPPLPWPKGIHKDVASQLAISNGESSRAFDAILGDETLLRLVGTGSTSTDDFFGGVPDVET